MILSVVKSPLKNKRFRAIWVDENDKKHHTDFGQKGAFTFIDGADESVRKNYIKRHMANPLERAKIVKLTPSPAVFSMYLLWGKFDSIEENINELNKMMIYMYKLYNLWKKQT